MQFQAATTQWWHARACHAQAHRQGRAQQAIRAAHRTRHGLLFGCASLGTKPTSVPKGVYSSDQPMHAVGSASLNGKTSSMKQIVDSSLLPAMPQSVEKDDTISDKKEVF